jgi:CheY-like chemotaxis protein/phosphoribosyl 1,2-cyclic phosphodiesterase
VEVVTSRGNRFIFDCGTGARALGVQLMASEPKPIHGNILLSHTHWDHIQGFPFFEPVFKTGNRFTVCGPHGAGHSLADVLAGQMEYTYFPVELRQLGAQIEYRDWVEGEYELDGIRITTQFLNHPAVTLGYRIEADGVSLVYLCDHEPYWERLWRSDGEPGKLESILHAGDLRYAAFMQNADVVIQDAQYTSEEYPAKKKWGHGTYSFAVQIAAAANVKRLFLTHHDPCHDDAFIGRIEEKAREIVALLGSPMKVSCAFEGFEECYQREDFSSSSSAPSHDPVLGGHLRVLVVEDDEGLRALARESLIRGGHQVTEARGGAEALELLEQDTPDLVLLDLNMPPPDGLETLRALRSRAATRALPVIVLTASNDEASISTSFEFGATDFLSKPFTPPQLEARIRSCMSALQASSHGRAGGT